MHLIAKGGRLGGVGIGDVRSGSGGLAATLIDPEVSSIEKAVDARPKVGHPDRETL